MKKKHLISILTFFISTPLIAEPAHDHGSHSTNQHKNVPNKSHQHGVIEGFIAQDEHSLLVEFHAPANDLVGFEHSPKTAQQKNKIQHTLTKLKNQTSLFSINKEAKCTLVEKHIADSFSKNDLDKDKKAGKLESEHHSFFANYIFHCTEPNKLDGFTTQWFSVFPDTNSIKIQAATKKGVYSKNIKASKPNFSF